MLARCQVSGHGNFGSVDDDPPAAMRYTECRLQSISMDMLLEDMEAGTVDFTPTFDGSLVSRFNISCGLLS